MKTKVQAQRKFAQGAFVRPTLVPERRTIEPPPDHDHVKVINHANISAKKILDSVTFSHPGMHLHSARVVLERLEHTSFKSGASLVATPSTSNEVKKRTKTRKPKQIYENKSTRILRSMRNRKESSSETNNSDDDRPLTYHSAKKVNGPAHSGSRKRKPTAKVQRQRTATSTDTKKRKQEIPAKQSRVPAKQSRKKRPKEPHGEENSFTQCSNGVCTEQLEEEPHGEENSFTQCSNGVCTEQLEEEPHGEENSFTQCSNGVCTEQLEQEPHGEANRVTQCLNGVCTEQLKEEPNRDAHVFPCVISVLKEEVSENPSYNEDPASRDIDEVDETTSNYPNTPCLTPAIHPSHGTSSGWPEESPSSSGFERTSTAPVFCPTEKEFEDPLQFYLKIAPEAAHYGICKVIAPASFKPRCLTTGLEHISASAQYPARFYKRWGEGVKEICAIKTYLASHCVYMNKIPSLQGREVNLPAMFRAVQKYGGFSQVTNKKLWGKIAEELNLFAISNPDKRLDTFYLTFMLPYDILTDEERDTLKANIEAKWQRKQQELQKRADNPLHMRKVYMCESDESSDECSADEDEDAQLREAFRDIEECVKHNRGMSLAQYKTVSDRTDLAYFPEGKPSLSAVETLYWKKVVEATDHDCVHAASVDTSEFGYGFTTDPTDPMSRHGWNLKNLRNNKENILRSLGDVVSTTVPILHLGMLFTTNCWHRDPHCLPWVEYLHKGQEKIWYGVPEQEDEKFRRAVERLCPTAVQNKKVWLPSDITMIPPKLLLDEGVSLTRITQKPGEFIFVFPKAYSSSICSGFTVSESVYFAVDPWQMTMHQVFQELRESCEPVNFSLEQLLIGIARDERVSRDLLQQIWPALFGLVQEELQCRSALLDRGVLQIDTALQRHPPYNIREEAECNVCRRPLYLSKVKVKNHKNLRLACPQDAYKILTKLEESPGKSSSCDRPIDFVLETIESDSGLKRVLSTCQKRL